MPRSLLDGADLPVIRRAAAARPGRIAALLACLLEGGVVEYAPDEPDWADRDHVVVGTEDLRAAIEADGGPEAVLVEGGRALAMAAGAACAGALDGGVARTYCLLDESALDDGAVWEAALVGPGAALTAFVMTEEGAGARAMFDAAGWCVVEASADDPVALLGALDRVQERPTRPGMVLVR